jgi:hypothetical protein
MAATLLAISKSRGFQMLNRASAALVVAFVVLSTPAIAADGQIVITQAKANAGNVTPGDAAGFPVKLSQPGSYILASNLTPPAGKGGITIASNDVTIDMNGFRLNGASVATTGISGGAFESATIRNGTVAGFDANGIYGTGNNWIIQSMRVVGNGASGITCYTRCLVEDSNVSENGAAGIYIITGTILGNVIFDNTGAGIFSDGLSGFGNNTLEGNNGGGANPQTLSGKPLDPNVCNPACP